MSDYKLTIVPLNKTNVEVYMNGEEDQVLDTFAPNSDNDKTQRFYNDVFSGDDDHYCLEITKAIVEAFARALERNGHTCTVEEVHDE